MTSSIARAETQDEGTVAHHTETQQIKGECRPKEKKVTKATSHRETRTPHHPAGHKKL